MAKNKVGIIPLLNQIKSKIANHDSSIANLSIDYVIEQGTNGEWTYRKWNNGTMEMWLYSSSIGSQSASSWGGFYWTTFSYSFPIPFVSPPVVSACFSVGTGYTNPAWTSPSNTGVKLRASGSQSGSQGVTGVQIYAIGQWK